MNQVHFAVPLPAHVDHIATNLRSADRQELFAMRGEDADLHWVLQNAVRRSGWSVCAISECGEPIAVFGVAPVSLIGGIGAPWLLGTDRMNEFRGALIRHGHDYIQAMTAHYPQLINYVDARNATSIRWLRRLGFTIHPSEPVGFQGMPFHKFTLG